MTEWMTKAELARLVEEGRQALDTLIQPHLSGGMHEPVMANGWTLKDIIAHITFWEQRLLHWLLDVQQGVTPERPAPGYTRDTMGQLNEDVHREQRKRPLENQLREYRASGHAVLSALQSLSEEDLNRPYFEDTGVILWRAFAANTYEHYEEHAEHIREWQQRAARAD